MSERQGKFDGYSIFKGADAGLLVETGQVMIEKPAMDFETGLNMLRQQYEKRQLEKLKEQETV